MFSVLASHAALSVNTKTEAMQQIPGAAEVKGRGREGMRCDVPVIEGVTIATFTS